MKYAIILSSLLTSYVIAKENTKIIVNEGLSPAGHVFGMPIFKVYHISTKQPIFVSAQDITRWKTEWHLKNTKYILNYFNKKILAVKNK